MGSSWVRVLRSVELGPRCLRKVEVGETTLLLARLKSGEVAAALNVCPHEGEDLSGGRLYMDGIDCPRHHYVYDLRTGENRYPQEVFPDDLASRLAALPIYPAREKDGWIWACLPSTELTESNDTPVDSSTI